MKEVVENYLRLQRNQCDFIESIDYSIPPCYPTDEEWEKIKSHIIKASYNIIDLIEVGDYVNGYKIIKIFQNHFNGQKVLISLQRDDVIDKVRECIKTKQCKYDGWNIMVQLYEDEIKEILEILDKVKGDSNE